MEYSETRRPNGDINAISRFMILKSHLTLHVIIPGVGTLNQAAGNGTCLGHLADRILSQPKKITNQKSKIINLGLIYIKTCSDHNGVKIDGSLMQYVDVLISNSHSCFGWEKTAADWPCLIWLRLGKPNRDAENVTRAVLNRNPNKAPHEDLAGRRLSTAALYQSSVRF